MASSILSSLLSKASLTVTDKSTGDDMATNWKVANVKIKYSAVPFRHMREDGVSIVDARIITPSSVSMSIICPTLDDVQIVQNIANLRDRLYRIVSKGLGVDNMVCTSANAKQSPEMTSATMVILNFESIMLQAGAYIPSVEQPADSSVFSQGLQDISSAVTTVNNGITSVVSSVKTIAQGLGSTISDLAVKA